MRPVAEGQFSTGLHYLRVGDGPPLIVSPGLGTDHLNPTGSARRRALAWAAPFAEHFTVYLTNRRPELAPGVTMGDIAADYAHVIEHDLGRPAVVHGTSTGGSVALQLAVDSPALVERLVVAASACRLSEHGRRVQAELRALVEAGDRRGATALLLGSLAPRPLSVPLRGVGWLVGNTFAKGDVSDMMATLDAEDAFDVEPDLHRVEAPTLVLGGSADPFYSEEIFRRTAEGVREGRAVVFDGKAHAYASIAKVPRAVALGFALG